MQDCKSISLDIQVLIISIVFILLFSSFYNYYYFIIKPFNPSGFNI